jgi:hypothetical protein
MLPDGHVAIFCDADNTNSVTHHMALLCAVCTDYNNRKLLLVLIANDNIIWTCDKKPLQIFDVFEQAVPGERLNL